MYLCCCDICHLFDVKHTCGMSVRSSATPQLADPTCCVVLIFIVCLAHQHTYTCHLTHTLMTLYQP
jgi:hypothetical protein